MHQFGKDTCDCPFWTYMFGPPGAGGDVCVAPRMVQHTQLQNEIGRRVGPGYYILTSPSPQADAVPWHRK